MHSIHEWLSRAAAVPKTLFLVLEQGLRTDLDPIHTIFASYPFQKLFVVRGCPLDNDETLIGLPNQLWEHLEELNLEVAGVVFPQDAKLSNLQSLSLSGWGPGNRDFGHYCSAIPWSQIRHLTLSDISISTIHLLFSVLKQCLRLEYCKIVYPRDTWPEPSPADLTLPSLHSFELTVSKRPHIFTVECMQRLIIPSVNILQLSLWNVDTSVYSRFIERSDGMPRLHTLTLYELGEPTDIGILLTLLPHLETITLSRALEAGYGEIYLRAK
jgi:hypothetical protein